MILFGLLAACSDATLSTKIDPPTVTITDPGEGARFFVGEAVTFVAVAGDGTGEPAEFDWGWSAGAYGDLVGSFGVEGNTGTFVQEGGFPAGEYEVAVQVTDLDARAAADSVHIEVVEDEAPLVELSSPADGLSLGDCEELTVAARVVDEDAVDIEETVLTWEGLPDGVAGPEHPDADGSATFLLDALAEGAWRFTVTATDLHGEVGSDAAGFTVHPCIVDACNGLDDDGDGEIDEDAEPSRWYADEDGDGHGDPGVYTDTCAPPEGWLADADDCDDADADVYPGAPERCNELDDDCDGETDEGAAGTLWVGEPTRGNLYQVATDGSGSSFVSAGWGSISDVEVHPEVGEIWVSQWDSPVSRRAALDGSGRATVYSGNGAGGQGIGVDPAEALFLWGEYYGDLDAGSPDGSVPPEIFLSKATVGALIGSFDGFGTGVELDPASRTVFLFTRSNSGASGRHLLKVGYDGSGLTDLRQIESQCLALDAENGWIYFADYQSGTYGMWRMDLDGGSATRLFDLADSSTCSGLAVDPATERLFYAQNQAGTVWAQDADGSDALRLASGLDQPQGLDLQACGD